jgi:hypothetical protein
VLTKLSGWVLTKLSGWVLTKLSGWVLTKLSGWGLSAFPSMPRVSNSCDDSVSDARMGGLALFSSGRLSASRSCKVLIITLCAEEGLLQGTGMKKSNVSRTTNFLEHLPKLGNKQILFHVI